MTNLAQPFDLNNALAEALEAYMTDYIVGDAVVYTEEKHAFDDSVYYIDHINQDCSLRIHNSIRGYVDNVPSDEIQHATISEIKNKRRGAEAVALFVSDVDLHLERAMLAQSEVS